MLKTLEDLIATIRQRKSSSDESSYTAKLLKDLSFNNLLVYEPSTGIFFLSLARVNKLSSALSILNSNRYSF